MPLLNGTGIVGNGLILVPLVKSQGDHLVTNWISRDVGDAFRFIIGDSSSLELLRPSLDKYLSFK